MACALRLFHVGIVQLTGEPASRCKLPAPGGAKPHREPLAARTFFGAPFHRPYRVLMTECLQKLDLTGALAPCAPYRPSNTCHMPRYFVTLIVAIALFMETRDSTVIATSLPAIAADLHEDPIALKLALT